MRNQRAAHSWDTKELAHRCNRSRAYSANRRRSTSECCLTCSRIGIASLASSGDWSRNISMMYIRDVLSSRWSLRMRRRRGQATFPFCPKKQTARIASPFCWLFSGSVAQSEIRRARIGTTTSGFFWRCPREEIASLWTCSSGSRMAESKSGITSSPFCFREPNAETADRRLSSRSLFSSF